MGLKEAVERGVGGEEDNTKANTAVVVKAKTSKATATVATAVAAEAEDSNNSQEALQHLPQGPYLQWL